jgi:hypothetical protein
VILPVCVDRSGMWWVKLCRWQGNQSRTFRFSKIGCRAPSAGLLARHMVLGRCYFFVFHCLPQSEDRPPSSRFNKWR